MSNTIINNAGDCIGYYEDLCEENKKYMKEFIEEDNYEQVETHIEIQGRLDEYKEYNGLLVITENNGAGWQVLKYIDYKEY